MFPSPPLRGRRKYEMNVLSLFHSLGCFFFWGKKRELLVSKQYICVFLVSQTAYYSSFCVETTLMYNCNNNIYPTWRALLLESSAYYLHLAAPQQRRLIKPFMCYRWSGQGVLMS